MAINYQEGLKRVKRIVSAFWIGLVGLSIAILSLLILIVNIFRVMANTGIVPLNQVIIAFIGIALLGGTGYIVTRRFSSTIIWVVQGFIGYP